MSGPGASNRSAWIREWAALTLLTALLVPLVPVQVWPGASSGVVCTMGCADTADCCCNPKPPEGYLSQDEVERVTAQPGGCPEQCATAAGSRTSKTAQGHLVPGSLHTFTAQMASNLVVDSVVVEGARRHAGTRGPPTPTVTS